MQKRIAVYLRVSTNTQSTDVQRADIEDYLAARNCTPVEFFEDKLSGTNLQRPALKQMMAAARMRKFDLIVVWKICRIARSLKDLVAMLQEFNELGVAFISLKDQIDMTTSSGRLLTHLLGAFAEFEASLIRERVIAGLEHAKKKGVLLGRPTTLNASEIQKLRSTGLSLSAIAAKIGCSKGAVSKTLKKMRAQTIENTCAPVAVSRVEKTEVLETPVLDIEVKND